MRRLPPGFTRPDRSLFASTQGEGHLSSTGAYPLSFLALASCPVIRLLSVSLGQLELTRSPPLHDLSPPAPRSRTRCRPSSSPLSSTWTPRTQRNPSTCTLTHREGSSPADSQSTTPCVPFLTRVVLVPTIPCLVLTQSLSVILRSAWNEQMQVSPHLPPTGAHATLARTTIADRSIFPSPTPSSSPPPSTPSASAKQPPWARFFSLAVCPSSLSLPITLPPIPSEPDPPRRLTSCPFELTLCDPSIYIPILRCPRPPVHPPQRPSDDPSTLWRCLRARHRLRDHRQGDPPHAGCADGHLSGPLLSAWGERRCV